MSDGRGAVHNPTTTVTFTLPDARRVRLDVYDATGRLVTRLFDEVGNAGENRVEWNGTNANGNVVGSGVYYVKMTAGKYTDTRKMVMLK